MQKRDDQIAPLYQKVKDHIVNKIQLGELLPTSRVQSENELVEELGVSRMTANRALSELAAEGILKRIAGVGTFVAEPQSKGHVLQVRNIAEEVRERGHHYGNIVVKHEKTAVTRELARLMEMPDDINIVYHTLIVHKEDEQMLQLEDRYVNAYIAPHYIDIDLKTTTPSQYLLRHFPLHKVEHTVRAAMPNAQVKSLLKMADNVPCLILDRRTWSSDNLVSLAHLYHSGHTFSLKDTFG